MPFGRYRGTPLPLVPLGYLAWLLEQCTYADPQLLADVRVEVTRRMGVDVDSGPMRLPDPATADAAGAIVAAGYRAVARRANPDAGGSHAAMIAATRARDWLRGALPSGVPA